MEHVHEAPYDAARGDIPARYAREIATRYSPDGDFALVFLATNEPPAVEEYEVICERSGAGWMGGSGGNGPGGGWHSTGGVTYFWDYSPEGATSAVIRSQAREHVIPVRNGYIAFAVWNTKHPVDIELLRFT